MQSWASVTVAESLLQMVIMVIAGCSLRISTDAHRAGRPKAEPNCLRLARRGL